MPAEPQRRDYMADEAHSAIPGEPGVWIIIFGDLLVFTLFFATFASYRLDDHAMFQTAQTKLSQTSGLINTLLLLTSSWLVMEAITAARAGAALRAKRLVTGAMLLGSGFVLVKFFEYRSEIQAGASPVLNDFFMLYFAFTGIHLLHVIVGIVALAFLRVMSAQPATPQRTAIMEACGIFWHLVDILWVVLYAILFLHH